MLPSFSNQFLAPDDVSVPCRVQACGKSSILYGEDGFDHDQTIIRQQIGRQLEEMTCTMRKWHKATGSPENQSPQMQKYCSETKKGDAELILTTAHWNTRDHSYGCSSVGDENTPIPLSKRFASFGGPDILCEQQEQEQLTSHPIRQRAYSSDTHQYRTGIQQNTKRELIISVNDITKIRTHGECDGKNSKNTKRNRSKNGFSCNKEHRRRRTISIETTSSGSYELLMESTNELLVLMTFLKVNAKKGKVAFIRKTDDDDCDKTNVNTTKKNTKNSTSKECSIGGDGSPNQDQTAKDKNDSVGEHAVLYAKRTIEPNPSNVTHDTAQTDGDKSMDVEAFTARRMSERMERETLTEKVERRMHRLVSSLEELGDSVIKCACGCFGDSGVVLDQSISIGNGSIAKGPIGKERSSVTFSRVRENTASTVALSEHPDSDIDTSMYLVLQDPSEKLEQRREFLINAQLPSGLSVESEDHAEDSLLLQSPTALLTKASV
mmetsp:Transcript_6206/g.13373  ORF Transcript_6206/g.13373 Transcript_6206/m.13373 type:complete len:493 (+) Transcript_6206:228-1706(+)